jgi:hypothetical protein
VDDGVGRSVTMSLGMSLGEPLGMSVFGSMGRGKTPVGATEGAAVGHAPHVPRSKRNFMYLAGTQRVTSSLFSRSMQKLTLGSSLFSKHSWIGSQLANAPVGACVGRSVGAMVGPRGSGSSAVGAFVGDVVGKSLSTSKLQRNG